MTIPINKKKRLFSIKGLDLQAELARNSKKSCSLLQKERASYILHYLIFRLFVSKKDWEKYTPVSSKVLASIMGCRDATNLKKSLVDIGIIESDDSYSNLPGRLKCKGYRFTDPYQESKFEIVYAETLGFVEPLEKMIFEKSIQTVQKTPYLKVVFETLRLLELNKQMAMEYIESSIMSENQKIYREFAACEFNDHQLFRDKNGRTYHNMVFLPRDLRKFVTINGEHLIGLDYKNCQPAILSYLYGSNKGAEFNKYIDVVSEGVFYKFINERLSVPFDLFKEEDVDELKRLCYKYIFYGPNRKEKIECIEVMKSEFPFLSGKIAQKKEKCYWLLANEMQAEEAKLVIDTICKNLTEKMNGNKDFYLIPIHDNLVTTRKYATDVRDCMKSCFLERFGFDLKIKEQMYV